VTCPQSKHVQNWCYTDIPPYKRRILFFFLFLSLFHCIKVLPHFHHHHIQTDHIINFREHLYSTLSNSVTSILVTICRKLFNCFYILITKKNDYLIASQLYVVGKLKIWLVTRLKSVQYYMNLYIHKLPIR